MIFFNIFIIYRYGHPAIAYMLMLTGMTHCGFKVIHRGTKPYAMVAVFFKTIT